MKQPVLRMSVVCIVEVAGCVPAVGHFAAQHGGCGVWTATVVAPHAVHEAQGWHVLEAQAPAISGRECGDLVVAARVGTCLVVQPHEEADARGQPEEHGPKHDSLAVAGEHRAAHE